MRVALLVLVLVGCNADKPSTGSAAPTSTPGSARIPIAQLVPTIDGAKLVKTRTRDEAQTFVVWCIDEQDATERVTAALRRDGWTEVMTRGSGDHIGVAASKPDARFSASTRGRDDKCAGSLVTATIMRFDAAHVP